MQYLKNPIKTKLKKNQRVIGSWLNLPSLEITEMMAKAGFEFLVIDCEHSAIDENTMQKMIMLIESNGVIPFVRVETNHPVPIKKALDAGAYGIIVPMVNNLTEAKQAVESVYYPPIGNRGVGLSRAQGYGVSFDKYKEWYQKNIVLLVQIEHRLAMENLDAICSVEEIDGTIIGPYDLSGSYGYPGEYHRDEIKKALKDYEKISKKCRKPYGFHLVQPELSLLQDKIKKGYTFLAYCIDELLFQTKCTEEMAAIQKLHSIKLKKD